MGVVDDVRVLVDHDERRVAFYPVAAGDHALLIDKHGEIRIELVDDLVRLLRPLAHINAVDAPALIARALGKILELRHDLLAVAAP